jgi:hypothetical protein
MPCVCERCARHAQTLGLEQTPRSRAPLRKAFRAAAKLWHPDRFERDPIKRLEAEEHFKQIQVAYRELTEHYEEPVKWPVESGSAGSGFGEPAFAASGYTAPRYTAPGHTPPDNAAAAPPISFGGAPSCFVAPDFSPIAVRIIVRHLRDAERAFAIVDLSGPASLPGSFAQFILLADEGIFVRDSRDLVSLLWYAHLGEIRLVAKPRRGLPGLWQRFLERLSGTEQKYQLEIWRRDGTLFHTIAGQVDDSIKKVIYNFLQQKRPRPAPVT